MFRTLCDKYFEQKKHKTFKFLKIKVVWFDLIWVTITNEYYVGVSEGKEVKWVTEERNQKTSLFTDHGTARRLRVFNWRCYLFQLSNLFNSRVNKLINFGKCLQLTHSMQ